MYEGNYSSLKNLKLYHHKEHGKSTKNKNNIRNPSLSTIKSKKPDCEKELNYNKDGQMSE